MEKEIIKNEILLELIYVADIKAGEDAILKNILPTYLRKLNCFLAGVIKCNNEQLIDKHLLPLMYVNNLMWSKIKEYIEKNKSLIEEKNYATIISDNEVFYIFKLSDYGYFVLGRKKIFDLVFINDLKHVISFTGKVLMQSIEKLIRKEFELKIANERKLLRTIIDNVPISIYAKDTEYRKTLANVTELRQFGCVSEDEVLGKTDFDLFGESIGVNTLKEDEKVMLEGIPILDEEKHIGKGEWALISKLPLRDENDKIIGIIGTSFNFTERRKTTEQLEIFNKLFDNLSDAIQISLENGQMFYVNKVASERLGISQKEVSKYKVYDFEESFKEEADWKEHVNLVKSTTSLTIEGLNTNQKTGKSFPVELIVKYIVVNENGYIVANSRDITERKKADEALKYSNERLEQLALQSRTFAWEINAEGLYTYVSPIVKTVLGYNPIDLVGKIYFYDIFAPELKEFYTKEAFKIIENKKPFNNFENKVINADGLEVWLLSNGSPMFNEDGDFLGLRGSDSDISERKKNEEQIKENEEYQRLLLENLSVGIMIIDPISRIIETVNTFASNIIGAPIDKIIGRRCHSFVCTEKDDCCPICDNNQVVDNSDKVLLNAKGVKVPILKTVKLITIGGKEKLLESFIEITERKQIEAKLRESDERKSSLIASMNDIVFVLDNEFRFEEYHNPKNSEWYTDPKTVFGQRYDEIGMPEAVTNKIGSALTKCFQTGETTKAEYYLEQNGLKKWFEINVTQLNLNLKNGLTCVVRDISENKAHQEFIYQQIRLQELLIKISTTYINIDLENINEVIHLSLKELGEFVGADRTYIFEYDFAENVCNNTYEWCKTDIQPEIDNLQEIPLEFISYWVDEHRKGNAFYVKDTNELPDDGPNCLRGIIEPQGIKSLITIPMIHENELLGFVGFDSVKHHHYYSTKEKQLLEIYAEMLVNAEIRKRGQEMLITQEEKYRNIISNMHLGFVELDTKNTITFINKQFSNMSGYSEEEMIGQPASKFLLAVDSEALLNYKQNFIYKKKSPSLELKLTIKNGEEVWWLINGAPQYNDKKELVGTISVFFDITPQKKLQTELEASKLIAESAAKAKELFLTNMSHEIRTPLNVIIGMIRELGKEQLSNSQQTYLAHSQASAYHLLSIINNVLDMSKIEAGEFSLEINDFSLSAVLSNVQSILASRAKSKKINFGIESSNNIERALIGDSVRLSQILINLLGNSIKFTNEGHVTLSVELMSTNKYYQRLRFEISDSGIGMSEDFQKNIFSKFTQENSRSNRNHEGTGLGMSISKELIELMGGLIELKSKKGEGTKISFELNLAVGDDTKLIKIDKNTRNIDISGFRILLVEDNEMNRFIARQSLNQANCKVTEAENGIEAVEILKMNNFDIILMDIQMPKMDGVEATKIIREQLLCKTPIIALTANAFKHDIDVYLSIGMNDFLIKPYKEEDLYSKIDLHLRSEKRKTKIDSLNGQMDELVLSTINTIEETEITESTKRLFNLEQLNEIGRGDEQFVKMMLEMFSKLASQTIEQLQNAYQIGDVDAIKKLAHKIKPSIDNLGIVSLFDKIRELETFDVTKNNNEDLKQLINKNCEVLKIVLEDIK
ncbi:MAG: PAS domain S-box protein [Paludibacter sp.]